MPSRWVIVVDVVVVVVFVIVSGAELAGGDPKPEPFTSFVLSCNNK